jgi:hypothetical protein
MRSFKILGGVLAAAALLLSQPAMASGKARARTDCHRQYHHHYHGAYSAWRPYYPPYYAYRIYDIPRYPYRPYYYTSWTYPYSGVYLVPRPAYYWPYRWRDFRW